MPFSGSLQGCLRPTRVSSRVYGAATRPQAVFEPLPCAGSSHAPNSAAR